MQKLFITNVVYGKEYTETFLYTLPSQLSNFQYLKNNSYPSLYRIYTTEEDKKNILQSTIFQKIQSLVKIEFINVDIFLNANHHYTITGCHNDAIKYANQNDLVIVFLLPDILLSYNVFEKICKSISSGKRALVAAILRLNKEDFKTDVQSSELINIKPRELIKKALSHLHQLTYDVFWQGKKLWAWPAILIWKLDKNNILIRGFHLHPLFVWPVKKKIKCKGTFDDELINYSCPDKNTWEVLEKSDEAVLFELTTKKRKNPDQYYINKLRTVFNFVKINLFRSHMAFSLSKIYILTTDYKKDEQWKKAERQSDKIINFVSKIFNNSFHWNIKIPFIKLKNKLKNKINQTLLKLKNKLRSPLIKLKNNQIFLIIRKKIISLIKRIYVQVYFFLAQRFFVNSVKNLPKDVQLFIISRNGIGAYLILFHYIKCWQKERGKTAIGFLFTQESEEIFNVAAKYICPETIIIKYNSRLQRFDKHLAWEDQPKIFNKIAGIICAQRRNTIQLFMPFNTDPIISEYSPYFDIYIKKYKKQYSKDFIEAYMKMHMRYDVNYKAMLDYFDISYNNNSIISSNELNIKLKNLLNKLKVTKKYVILNLNLKDYFCPTGNSRKVKSFENYDALIDYLISQNYQVILQGREEANTLNLKSRTDLIEYYRSKYCSVENDLALYSGAEFAITNKSGPMLFAIVCNIPLLVLEYCEWPANHAFKKFRFYPKPIKNIISKKYLSWKLLLKHPGFFNHHIIQNKFEDFIYEEMSIEETISVLKEFLELVVKDEKIWTQYSNLQKEFLNNLTPLHMELYHSKVIPSDEYLQKYYN